MKLVAAAVRRSLRAFDFSTLFREHLGWDKHQATLKLNCDGATVTLSAVAEKRGFVAFVCDSIPERRIRLKIDHQVTKSVKEHFVIYCDRPAGQQVWHWVRREPGKPLASRDHRFDTSQSGDRLIQRLEQIAVSLDDEDTLTLVDVNADVRAAFDVDRVTRRFFEQFKTEHAAFLSFITGIDVATDREWYTSLMLNRLMFVYFIQKKGFLDSDVDYLRNRMQRVRELRGNDKFQTFYRYFLLRLFQEGLGKSAAERKLDPALERLLGTVPYLNGGFFEVHQLEERHATIDIPDKAFERLFGFFDRYAWHLDDRPLRTDSEINPDVVGYIFEKYINQKQMGAYYTKEDITEYISKNTVLPFLFDAAQARCPIAFEPDSFLWRLLQDDPDRYIYSAVRHGVVGEGGAVIPLPSEIVEGVDDVLKRGNWNRLAGEPFGLPTETWREHIARRTHCLEVREKLTAGSVHEIDELVTLNLDIWQFARDAVVTAEGPELVRAFWEAIDKVTVLDPTCGSGAFLFAALRILETLYADCLERMERFVEEHEARPIHPDQFADFKKVLAQIDSHPNERYFILKSVIVNNLFGVDIMEEAVEICKLRLFLKLAAQVDSPDRIEPLPDIDFNIRAGNSLVGYATKQDARRAFTANATGQGRLMLGDSDQAYERFEESAAVVERAFKQFRDQQTTYGGRITLEDKLELRRRLAVLDGELDQFLASEYSINPKNKAAFEQWRARHQPFHWFVHFYGIMRAGGFDVVVGNPPYLERSKLKGAYEVHEFKTSRSRDIYAWVVERATQLRGDGGRLGLIVPVSIVSSGSFGELRDVLAASVSWLWLASFANRPGQLFVGAQNRLTIVLAASGVGRRRVFATRYYRWSARDGERDSLLAKLTYVELDSLARTFHGLYPKIGDRHGVSILRRLLGRRSIGEQAVEKSRYPVYWVRVPGYFCQFFLKPPQARPEHGGSARPRGELNEIFARNETEQRVIHAALNSSTYYQFFSIYTDGRHINPSDVVDFPLDLATFDDTSAKQLVRLSKQLETSMSEHLSEVRKSGLLIESVDSRPTKPILDRIDGVLAKHYGFSSEELDFVVNYDVKYRVGAEDDAEDE